MPTDAEIEAAAEVLQRNALDKNGRSLDSSNAKLLARFALEASASCLRICEIIRLRTGTSIRWKPCVVRLAWCSSRRAAAVTSRPSVRAYQEC